MSYAHATRSILITGATDGLGRALATMLARRDTRLILHGRAPDRLQRLLAELQPIATHPLRTLQADFSDLTQVNAAAQDLTSTLDELHVLINNAGIGSGEPEGRQRSTSRDGHELRFAVNYLAPFLFTETLLPILRVSATPTRAARIIHVASIGQHPLDFDDLMLTGHYDGLRAYTQSKLAQIMHTFDLAERLPAHQITANSLHPGTFMPTKIVLSEIGHHVDTLDTGVNAVRSLALDPEHERVTGRFFDRTTPAQPHPQATDGAARHELRRRTLQLLGGHAQELQSAAP